MSDAQPRPTGNRILDALPAQEFSRLSRYLVPARFAPGSVLHHLGDEINFIHFPVSAVFSVNMPLSDGSCLETGTIGDEGFFGLSGLFGDGVAHNEVTIHVGGDGFCLPTPAFREEVDRSGSLRDLCVKLSQLVVAEISQTAACNARHDLRSRCARWLLAMQDKVGRQSFPASQEVLAALLGVQRPAVTGIAQSLRREELIRYRRGLVEICDRARLTAVACECYRVMRDLRDGFLRPQVSREAREFGDPHGEAITMDIRPGSSADQTRHPRDGLPISASRQ